MNKDRVVVYGGSGFLGSHVSDALTDAGYKVIIFDRVVSPYLRDDQEMFQGDLLDQKSVSAAVFGCKYAYNFAGLADIDEARNRPVDTVKLNILGNVHALEAARLAGVKRFIFASSVYVYSEAGSFYRASKQASERFVEAYQERYGLSYTILRYGSLYGRRADMRNGIYRLLRQALVERRIEYKGSADAMREYIHVTDAARLSVRILDDSYTNRHLILTGQERMAVKNLMTMIAEMIAEGAVIDFSEEPAYGHYVMTPYAFNPRLGKKVIANEHVDIGQGLLDCMAEIHEQLHHNQNRQNGDWIISDY